MHAVEGGLPDAGGVDERDQAFLRAQAEAGLGEVPLHEREGGGGVAVGQRPAGENGAERSEQAQRLVVGKRRLGALDGVEDEGFVGGEEEAVGKRGETGGGFGRKNGRGKVGGFEFEERKVEVAKQLGESRKLFAPAGKGVGGGGRFVHGKGSEG